MNFQSISSLFTMPHFVNLIGVVVAIFAASTAVAQDSEATVITTNSGSLKGKDEGSSIAWLRIPYAKPPVGALRWHAPQQPEKWAGVRDATQFGQACWQTPSKVAPESSLQMSSMSEDCLTLNVWKPKINDNKKLPVMVWFHGGGFRVGASSLSLYNGNNLASEGVIVVSVNYRLGPFGVFPLSPIMKENPAEPKNFGLLDQIAALQWVKNNISHFGGDSTNITIWGESAGGASVGYLLQSPLAKDLFSKAIMQSGALDLPEYTTDQAIGLAVKGMTEKYSAMDVKELRRLSPQQVLKIPLEKTQTMPIIDGVSLLRKTSENLSLGEISSVPLLIGSNDYEAGYFPSKWSDALPEKMGASWKEARSLTDGYGTDHENLKAAQLASDKFATLPTRQFADGMKKTGAPVYRYYFSWVTPEKRDAIPGAIHTAEIPYVFGNLHFIHDNNFDDKELSLKLMKRWATFALTGTPNVGNLPFWPEWRSSDSSLWSIEDTGEIAVKESGKARLDYLCKHGNFSMN